MYFKIKQDGVLYVSSPLKYKNSIQSILLSKSEWIVHYFALLESQKKLVSIDAVLFFGKPLSLVIQPIKVGKQNAIIESSTFTLLIKDIEKYQHWLDHFLKIHTANYIQDILPEWIQKTSQIPNQIQYRKMKKWGACTKKGTLIFNSYLICLPPALIEYIVCHELIHLMHFNHSRKFHETVATFLPDVKKLEKELKMYVR